MRWIKGLQHETCVVEERADGIAGERDAACAVQERRRCGLKKEILGSGRPR